MALPWALAVLSLLPLLDAQSPACPNFSVPITNASLDQVGAWALSAMGAVSSLDSLPLLACGQPLLGAGVGTRSASSGFLCLQAQSRLAKSLSRAADWAKGHWGRVEGWWWVTWGEHQRGDG